MPAAARWDGGESSRAWVAALEEPVGLHPWRGEVDHSPASAASVVTRSAAGIGRISRAA
jgi:hypothetical protein